MAWAVAFVACTAGCDNDPRAAPLLTDSGADGGVADGASTGGAGGGYGGTAGVPNTGGQGGLGIGGIGGSAECNNLVIDGPVVTPVPGTGTPPVPQGGTILDGHWVLTGYEYFGSDTLNPIAATYDIRNNVVQYVNEEQGATVHQTFTISVSGTQVTKDLICPRTATQVDGFTATPAEITFIRNVSGVTSVFRITKTGP